MYNTRCQPSNRRVTTSLFKLLCLNTTALCLSVVHRVFVTAQSAQLQFCPWLSLGKCVSSLTRYWMRLALQRPVKVWGGAQSTGQGDPLTWKKHFLPLSLSLSPALRFLLSLSSPRFSALWFFLWHVSTPSVSKTLIKLVHVQDAKRTWLKLFSFYNLCLY